MKRIVLFAALCALPGIAAAGAPYQEFRTGGYDPYAADAIARGDYIAAEDRLLRRLDANGQDVSAMINLASVMVATQRVARASSLYEQVLASDEVVLQSFDGSPISSHQLAQRVLSARVRVGAR